MIIGEKINSSLTKVRVAIEKRDAEPIVALASAQLETGAAYLDVNAGAFLDDEPEMLSWLVSAIQRNLDFDVRLSLDSSNSLAIKAALQANKSKKPIINSITAQKRRLDGVLPLIKEYGASVVALCMDDGGIPDTAVGRVKIAAHILDRLTGEGIGYEDIYLDPIVTPIRVDPHGARIAVDAIAEIRKNWPAAHIICGLSNISYGTPARAHLNRAFLAAAAFAGLDSAIMDPLDQQLMATVYAIDALAGNDAGCAKYIKAFREGVFGL